MTKYCLIYYNIQSITHNVGLYVSMLIFMYKFLVSGAYTEEHGLLL